jgi:hypothetical protein
MKPTPEALRASPSRGRRSGPAKPAPRGPVEQRSSHASWLTRAAMEN